MCGIAGILRFDGAPVETGWIEAMTAALRHRGPDGEGVWRQGPLALGHTRLAIIDPAGGQQPMANEDGMVLVTYNGEIYNFKDLRRELEQTGHRFRTASDTEVVLHAYEQWDVSCVERFRGMFAFCVADLRQRRLFLARDHLGMKPLYYCASRNMFAFASELAALRLVPGLHFTVSGSAMDHYLWLQYIPAPHTIYEEARKLPPAARLTVSFDGKISGPEIYWRLEFVPDERPTWQEWQEALGEVVKESVRAHLVADVPFGAFLSGGIDSTLVVSFMTEILDRPVKTFTIGFEDAEYDERPFAALAASQLGTEHHTEVVCPNALALLPELVRHYGEPFGDSSAIPTYYVSRLAREHVPMVLSGDGGDEAFAGYAAYADWLRWLDGPGNLPRWKSALLPLARAFFPRRFSRTRQPSLENWLWFVGYLRPADRARLWRPEYRKLLAETCAALEAIFNAAGTIGTCSRAQSWDYRMYLPNDILTKVDIASMMHGLEVRIPLVDVQVVEFAAKIPERLKIERDGNGGWRGKLPLKQFLSQRFPPEFVNRRKQGFAVPLDRWLKTGEGNGNGIRERLLAKDSPLQEYFDPAGLAAVVDQGWPHVLWLLLFLDEWLRQHKAGSVRKPRLPSTLR